MLKLILSDIDGTLLPFDRQALSGELFELIRAFHSINHVHIDSTRRF